jgi:glycine/D-amino acid oxidase-like deaminating enzyme
VTVSPAPSRTADVVVVGAGMVGAACAYYAARAGLSVAVVDRGGVAGGTTGAGEGNLLVSDKSPGPELDLTLYSLALWRELAGTLDRSAMELEFKGGVVVSSTGDGYAGLRDLAETQRAVGVTATDIPPGELASFEPHLAPGLAGGMHYPQDMQVQPMAAAAHLLRTAVREHGATVHTGARVVGIERRGQALTVRTDTAEFSAATVVNAAGTWSGDIAALAGIDLPILPRRGFILVTQPLPDHPIRHKVYAAEYMANVASDDADLQTSPVVEGTRSGTVLIGSSRERVGFDRTMSLPVLRRLAAQAVALFPFLAGVHVIRAYRGFRPYCPDHLPVIGPDPRLPGLLHACGHEGAGIGLAPATGALIAGAITGTAVPLDYPGTIPALAHFRPDRFGEATRG